MSNYTHVPPGDNQPESMLLDLPPSYDEIDSTGIIAAGDAALIYSGPLGCIPVSEQRHEPVGYENLTYSNEIILPPDDSAQTRNYGQDRITGMLSLTSEDVQEAVVEYVSSKCCHGKSAARNMVVRNVRMDSAFSYTLETFCEKRELAWTVIPYDGKPVSSSLNGPAPGPWEVNIVPTEYFVNVKKKVEVPHTACIKFCEKCLAIGRIRCDKCNGTGQVTCHICNGMGRHFLTDCKNCFARGCLRCNVCIGNGQTLCSVCQGKTQIKIFVQLTVTWINHKEEYTSSSAEVLLDNIEDVNNGLVVLDEEESRVWPLTPPAEQAMCSVSRNLIQKHLRSFPNEKILRQRHILRVIPITEARYVWKNKERTCYVYGYENDVHFVDKYPQDCCCGCIIL